MLDAVTRFSAHAARRAAGILFPSACAGCLSAVDRPGLLCGPCWSRLRLIEKPWCAVLGTPFSTEMGEDAVSPEAIAHPPPFRRARAAASYTGVARVLVQGLKYRDRPDLAPWMAEWMIRAGGELIGDAELVVPVPLHRLRFLSRRFNQSAELARTIAERTGVPFRPDAVRRVKATRRQVGLGIKERERNVRGAFRVPDEASPVVAGRQVLLVDDVYTTGSTVSAIARSLERSGAAAVDVLTFARVLPGDFLADEAAPI